MAICALGHIRQPWVALRPPNPVLRRVEYGVDKVIQTKEQADLSLPYLLAVALVDGDIMLAQFSPDRIARADVQQLLKKVSVRRNQEYTDEYPEKMPAKITVRLQDGSVIEHEVEYYPGLASHPFTWEDYVAIS